MLIKISKIIPNPEQPRKHFDPVALRELADSIHENGLINPITVEENPEGGYILISGERRLKAHQLLGEAEIEANVRPYKNGKGGLERAVLALIENLQRADLSPSEEARGYARLKELGLSNNGIAHRLGVSIPRVVSRLSILEIEPEIQDLIDANLLPVDQRVVKALKAVPAAARVDLARKLARPGLRIQTVITACEKLNAALSASKKPDGTPAEYYAFRHAGAPDLPSWDALHQLGKVPPWEAVRKATIFTCQTCVLRSEASAVICAPCPAVVMLSSLIKVSHEHRCAD